MCLKSNFLEFTLKCACLQNILTDPYTLYFLYVYMHFLLSLIIMSIVIHAQGLLVFISKLGQSKLIYRRVFIIKQTTSVQAPTFLVVFTGMVQRWFHSCKLGHRHCCHGKRFSSNTLSFFLTLKSSANHLLLLFTSGSGCCHQRFLYSIA